MKSVSSEIKKKEIEFPRLMRGNGLKGHVVLFVSRTTGIAMASHYGSSAEIGKLVEDLDIDAYSPFTGTITLSND